VNRWAVYVEGLESIQDIDRMRPEIQFKMVQTINTTTTRFRTRAAEMIRAQVNFPARYLNPAQKRLYVTQKATRGKPEGVISARSRPTSLARFVTNYTPGKEGVNVEVEPGNSTFLKRAFLVKLPAGTGPVDTQYNLGLAIRLGKGQTMRNKRTAIRLDRGLYLLYGPSIDQVFLNATGARAGEGVATEMTPDMLDFMQREFLRLWDLDF